MDPGLSGALAVYCPGDNKIVEIFDVPVVPSGVKNRNTVNVSSLALSLGSVADEIAFVVFEDVHSTPNDGPVGAFAFGKSTGIVIGMIGAFMIPVFFTPPSVWKNVMGLSRNKDESRALATKKFPLSSHLWQKKEHDGRAEAALLAYFGKRFW